MKRSYEEQRPCESVIHPLELRRYARNVKLAIVGAVCSAVGGLLQHFAPLLLTGVTAGAVAVLVAAVVLQRRLALGAERWRLPEARVRR